MLIEPTWSGCSWAHEEQICTSSKKQLSCSLPNPTLEREKYLKHDDYDFSKLRLDDLEFVATLGVGGFGRVELVQVK